MATTATETTIPRHIFNAAAACRSSLKDCLTVEALKEHGWAENRLADFDLWAAGVGASAAAQASLDWRLHFQPEARIVLTNLLVTLKEFVEQCRELGMSNDASNEQIMIPQLEGWMGAGATANNVASSWFENLDLPRDEDASSNSTSTSDEDPESEPSNSVLDEAKQDTEDMLDELIRLGLAIRKSGTNARLRKADSSFKEEKYQDLQRYLSLDFLVQAGKLLDNQGMDTNRRLVDLDQGYHQLSQQQKHLILANLRRRHRFAYARRHQRKLEGSLDIDTVQGRERKEGVRPDKTTKPATPSRVASKVIRTGKPQENAHQGPAMTTTTASAVEGDVLKAAAAFSQAASRVSVTTAKLSYPSPPPVPDGVRGFKCPCCYQALPIMFLEKARWRKHLAEDLSPYTCPFDDCKESDVLYATRAPWRTHINTQHGALHYWECLPCQGAETFDSAEEFATHSREHHKDTVAAAQLCELQQLCHRVVPPRIKSCPLCSWQQQDGDPAAMIEHIGDCIHEFSLKALPWAESNHAVAFCCPSETEEMVSQWLDATEPPKPIEGHQTELRFLNLEVPAPAKDHLFVVAEYFAENEEAASAEAKSCGRSSRDSRKYLSAQLFDGPGRANSAASDGREVVAMNHPSTLTSMNTLALIYLNQGRLKEAEELQLRVMETNKSELGTDHPDTLTSINSLALIYMNQGRWEEAEKLEVQVIEMRKSELGADHRDTLRSMANLAITYMNQGRWEEAEKLKVQVMETYKAKLGADHPDTLTSINSLASTYRSQGRWEEAEKLEVQVMETRKAKLGVDHPDTLTSINSLALIYMNQGRWEEAEKLKVQVMETYKAKLGADHPDTLTSINSLASTYRSQGRWEEAEKLKVQVMETYKAKLGADHPDTLTSINSLTLIYMNQGRWEEAEKLEVQVMETRKAKLGVDHPDTLTSINSLALIYMNQGRWEEAEKLKVQVMETYKAKLGADHPDTLTSINSLASTYRSQGRWEEAEKLEVQVMETYKIMLGADHPDTLTSMNNLAFTWKSQGRNLDALALMEECAQSRQRQFGKEHPDTLFSLAVVADWSRLDT